MNDKGKAILEDCTRDLERAVWTMIQQRMDWARLPPAQREKLRTDMDRTDRAVLNASMERVISSVAMFARLEAARAEGPTQ